MAVVKCDFVAINPTALIAQYGSSDPVLTDTASGVKVALTSTAIINLFGNVDIYFGYPLGTVTGGNFVVNGQVRVSVTGVNINIIDLAPYLSDPLGGVAFVLKGNDTVIGANVVGIDHLRAGGGNDTIQGRLGKDIVDGGTGVDTAVYSEKAVGIALTLKDGALIASQYTGVTGVLGGNAVISPAKLEDYVNNIENVTGGSGGDFLGGNAAANILTGNAGNDTLKGNGGNDILLGGAGNDFLEGGAGKDTQTGGAGNDTFRYTAITQSAVGANADIINDFDKAGSATTPSTSRPFPEPLLTAALLRSMAPTRSASTTSRVPMSSCRSTPTPHWRPTWRSGSRTPCSRA